MNLQQAAGTDVAVLKLNGQSKRRVTVEDDPRLFFRLKEQRVDHDQMIEANR